MRPSLLSLSFSLFSVAMVACAGNTGATEDGTGLEDAELRASGVTAIEIGRGTGFRPPPPPGSCHASGRYTVDFVAKQIKGNGCVEGRTISVDRPVSDDELARVRTAFANVKTAPRPAACPTDIPVTSLNVKRGSRETFYVDERAACGGGARAAVSSTLAALLDVAQDLAVAGATCGTSTCAADEECINPVQSLCRPKNMGGATCGTTTCAADEECINPVQSLCRPR